MRRARWMVLAAVLAIATLGPATSARAGGGAAPPPCQEMPGAGGGDLAATEFTHYSMTTAPDATQVGAADVQLQGLNWDFNLNNFSAAAVAGPTVSVDSGLPPSVFVTSQLKPSMFPISCGLPTLDPASGMSAFAGQLQETGQPTPYTPTAFRLGYSSTREVSPLTIPAGGGPQSVTVRVTLTDPRFAAPAIVNLHVTIEGAPGATWSVGAPTLNHEYLFAATVDVPNGPAAIQHRPGVLIEAAVFASAANACPGSDRQVCIADPTLDGARPGAGIATYSIAAGGHSWSLQHGDWYGTTYPEQLPPAQQVSSLVGIGLETAPVGAEAVHATLVSGGKPQPGRPVTFNAGSSGCQGTTGSDGVATCSLSPALVSGRYPLRAGFAGDAGLSPASAMGSLIVYQPTQFVIWGGNPGGVRPGADYNFWGAHWADQVTGGDYSANASFKGYADQVSGRTWTASPGASGGPPPAIDDYIGVLVATSATKRGGSISGAVGGIAILKVDDPAAYSPDPGHPASGIVVQLTG